MKRALLAASVALLTAVPSWAAAADTGSADNEPQDIVVTGEREKKTDPYAGGQVARGGRVGILGEGDYMETPYSVTSFTEKFLRDQQAVRISDALRNDPAVRTAGIPSASTTERPVIRGFPLDTSNSAVDGLYGLGSSRNSSTYAVERIELIKGPNSLLSGNGSGAVGGAINLVSKVAGDEPLTRMIAGWTSEDLFAGQLDVGRRFGATKAFGLRVNVAGRSGSTEIDYQRVRAYAVSVLADYRDDRLSAFISYYRDYENILAPNNGISIAEGVPVPKPPKRGFNTNQPWGTKDTRLFERIHGRISYQLDADTSVSVAHGVNRNPDAGLFKSTDLRITGADGSAEGSVYQARSSFPLESSEANFRTGITLGGITNSIVIAATRLHSPPFKYDDFGGDSFSTNIYRPVLIPEPASVVTKARKDSPYGTSTSSSQSIVVADTLGFFQDRALVTIGARYQNVRSKSFDEAGDVAGSYSESAVTPSVGLVYRITPKLSVYGNYIQGLSEGPSAPLTGVSNPGEVFSPVKTRQYEGGVKTDFGRFGATLALFDITRPNNLLVPDSAGTLPRFTVDGEQRNRGIELSFFGEPITGVRLLGGYALIDATQRRTQDGTNDGLPVVGNAKHAVSTTIEWDTPFIPGLTLTGYGTWESSRSVDATAIRRIPSWERFDLGARYGFAVTGKPMTLRLNIQNVLNANDWVGSFFGLVQSAPRTALLSLQVDL